uniref:Uncharacterized protein n=1 Tax=Anguilla anguilla TaxID=7936 RepID=A0A0E9T2G9_ANGAN
MYTFHMSVCLIDDYICLNLRLDRTRISLISRDVMVIPYLNTSLQER